jgi:hypothetical protein
MRNKNILIITGNIYLKDANHNKAKASLFLAHLFKMNL